MHPHGAPGAGRRDQLRRYRRHVPDGESEEIVGKAIAGRRDEVVLASKFHNPMGSGPNDRGNSRVLLDHASRRSEPSQAGGTDHPDLYQVHRPEEETDIEETLAALTDLQRAGTYRAFGTSTYAGWQLVQAQSVSERRGLARFRTEQPPDRSSCATSNATCSRLPRNTGWGCWCGRHWGRGWLTGRYRRAGSSIRSPEARATRNRERGGPTAAQFDEDRPEIQQKLDVVEELAAIADGGGSP